MAHGISRVGVKVSIRLDDGETQVFNYNDLKYLIMSGQMYVDNMYITEGGQLRFLPSDNNDMTRRYTTNAIGNTSDNRNAGWHSGGMKKPYGFMNR